MCACARAHTWARGGIPNPGLSERRACMMISSKRLSVEGFRNMVIVLLFLNLRRPAQHKRVLEYLSRYGIR